MSLISRSHGYLGSNINKAGTEAKVFIGQTLEDAKKAMARRNTDFGEGAFDMINGDPDESTLAVTIDESHTSAIIWYSKAMSQVTKLSMLFRPHRQALKPEYSWIPATELVLNEDRSYSVEFKPALTDDDIKKREEKRRSSQTSGQRQMKDEKKKGDILLKL
jgi:hypothetical protein